MQFPAHLEPATEGGFVVTFRDIPEAITQGDTREEAICMASDALITAMDFYFEDKRTVPMPSDALPGEELIPMPASIWAKVLLLNVMVESKVRPTELARRMGVQKQEMTRLMDLHHQTKIDGVQSALNALGCQLEIRIFNKCSLERRTGSSDKTSSD